MICSTIFKEKLSIFIVCAFCTVCTDELRCLTFNKLLLHRPSFKLLPYCSWKIVHFVKIFSPNFSNIVYQIFQSSKWPIIIIFVKWHWKSVKFVTVEVFDTFLDSLNCCFLHKESTNPLKAKDNDISKGLKFQWKMFF